VLPDSHIERRDRILNFSTEVAALPKPCPEITNQQHLEGLNGEVRPAGRSTIRIIAQCPQRVLCIYSPPWPEEPDVQPWNISLLELPE